MKKFIAFIAIIILVGAVYLYRSRSQDAIKIDLPPAQEYEDFVQDKIEEEVEEPVEQEPVEEPVEDSQLVLEDDVEQPEPEVLGKKIAEPAEESINLAVPFTSQAPTANWDQPFQDACEEASVLMVDYYYRNQSFPSKVEVEDILLEMVGWQEENWDGHFNLPTAKVAEFTFATFNYQTEIVEDLTVEKIVSFLEKGMPVIVPADGHKLANPNFRNDGPDYHMLVIKGYSDGHFITNDPGTRNGADFIYTKENLMYSIADWDPKKDQAIGPKLGLVLYKS